MAYIRSYYQEFQSKEQTFQDVHRAEEPRNAEDASRPEVNNTFGRTHGIHQGTQVHLQAKTVSLSSWIFFHSVSFI